MAIEHVVKALLLERGCPKSKLNVVMDDLGPRVPPNSIKEVLEEVDAAIARAKGTKKP